MSTMLLAIFVILVEYTVQYGDLYSDLGVERTADANEIKRRYRKMALLLHPDKWRSSEAKVAQEKTAKFQAVAHAFEVLSNPVRRENYDLLGEDFGHEEDSTPSESGGEDSTAAPEFRGGVYVAPDGSVIFEPPEATSPVPAPPAPPLDPFPADGPVVPLTEDNMPLMEQATKSGQVWFINFYHQNCGPCRKHSGAWKELANRIGEDAVVAAIDVDEESHLASTFNIEEVPKIIAVTAIGPLIFTGDQSSSYDLELWARGVLTGGSFTATPDEEAEEPPAVSSAESEADLETPQPHQNSGGKEEAESSTDHDHLQDEPESPEVQEEGERMLREAEAAHEANQAPASVPESPSPPADANEKDHYRPQGQRSHIAKENLVDSKESLSQRESEENDFLFAPDETVTVSRAGEGPPPTATETQKHKDEEKLTSGPDDFGELWDKVQQGPAELEDEKDGETEQQQEEHSESHEKVMKQNAEQQQSETNAQMPPVSEGKDQMEPGGLDSFNTFIDEQMASPEEMTAKQEGEVTLKEEQGILQGTANSNVTISLSPNQPPLLKRSRDEGNKEEPMGNMNQEGSSQRATGTETDEDESFENTWKGSALATTKDGETSQNIDEDLIAAPMPKEDVPEEPNPEETQEDQEVLLAAEKLVADAEAAHFDQKIKAQNDALDQDVRQEAEKMFQEAEEKDAYKRHNEGNTMDSSGDVEETQTKPCVAITDETDDAQKATSEHHSAANDSKGRCNNIEKVPLKTLEKDGQCTSDEDIQWRLSSRILSGLMAVPTLLTIFVSLLYFAGGNIWAANEQVTGKSGKTMKTSPGKVFQIECPKSGIEFSAMAGMDGLAQVRSVDETSACGVLPGDILMCIENVALGYQEFRETEKQLADASEKRGLLLFLRCEDPESRRLVLHEFLPCDWPTKVGHNPVEIRHCAQGLEKEIEVENDCELLAVPHISAPKTGMKWQVGAFPGAQQATVFRGRQQPCHFVSHPGGGGWAPCLLARD